MLEISNVVGIVSGGVVSFLSSSKIEISNIVLGAEFYVLIIHCSFLKYKLHTLKSCGF